SYAKNDGLFSSGYYLFHGGPSESLRTAVQQNEQERLAGKAPVKDDKAADRKDKRGGRYRDRLWKGWILPAADADTWFAAGSARYHDVIDAEDLDNAIEEQRAEYRGLRLAPDDPLRRFRL